MTVQEENLIMKVASDLREASENSTAMEPIRSNFNVGDISSAYQVQKINNDFRKEKGAISTGKKIGLTSKKVQEQLGVDQPDFGVLFNDMNVENGGSLSWSETMQPKVEAEVAFVLKKDITASNPTLTDIEDAIDYAVVSLEIVGSRIKDWNINILDTVADNASASHYVLGTEKKKLSDIDLINCKMNMSVNGTEVSTGEGKACLGSPLIAVQWLAVQMAEVGNPLKAGEVILSGALGPMAAIQAGDVVSATIEGLGEVSIKFLKE
tara:strand:+ start:972 stop:1769 length:798 start_codon:yes stop_codon:yes gene_type:complete